MLGRNAKPLNRRKRRSSIACAASLSGLDAFKRSAAASASEASVAAKSPSSRVTVLVRCRPLSEKERLKGAFEVVEPIFEESSDCSAAETKSICITKLRKKGAVLKSEQGGSYEYSFDSVFGENSTQDDVFQRISSLGIVDDLIRGVNVTVFAYGATGAGKTHTMFGYNEEPGVVPKAMVELFEGVQKASQGDQADERWTVNVSYLEVYNEVIYDLLTDEKKHLLPCEDSLTSSVKVLNLTEVEVDNLSTVLQLLEEGNARRKMEPTAANQVSSRSHAVLQVNIRHEKMVKHTRRITRTLNGGDTSSKIITSSRLSLIDLAGSERAAATQNRGARLREGANINKSLLALANCINALSLKGTSAATRVKYRDSKLTHILKSSLQGKCRVVMIAAVSPSHHSYEETHNTLKYANRAKEIKVKAKVNVERVPVRSSRRTTRRKASPSVDESMEKDPDVENVEKPSEAYSPRKFTTAKKRKSTSPDSSSKRTKVADAKSTGGSAASSKRKTRSKLPKTRARRPQSASSPVKHRKRPATTALRSRRSDPVKEKKAASPPARIQCESPLKNRTKGTVDDRMLACFNKHLERLKKGRSSTSPAQPPKDDESSFASTTLDKTLTPIPHNNSVCIMEVDEMEASQLDLNVTAASTLTQKTEQMNTSRTFLSTQDPKHRIAELESRVEDLENMNKALKSQNIQLSTQLRTLRTKLSKSQSRHVETRDQKRTRSNSRIPRVSGGRSSSSSSTRRR